MTARVLNPIQFGAVGNGDPVNAAKDTKAFADMTRHAIKNPADTFTIRLPPSKCFMLEVTDTDAYRDGWTLDGLKNVVEVGCAMATPRASWSRLKLKPANFAGKTADLIAGGRNQPFENLWFKRVILDGSCVESNRSMDTQQSQLLQIGTKGVRNIGFEDVEFRDVAADGIKTGGTTVTPMDGLTMRRVHAYRMGRAALVIQGNSQNILIEDCDGDENFKAWLDSEPTSGFGPRNITIRRTKLFCGVTKDSSGILRRPAFAASFAGISGLDAECMDNVLVEDCQLDTGMWLRNLTNAQFVRCQGDSNHEIDGYKFAIHMDERVEAEFFDCDFEGEQLALYATHHNSVGRIPKKIWFSGCRLNGKSQVMSLDSAMGLKIEGGTLELREPTLGGEYVFVTNSLKGQNITGFEFKNIGYGQSLNLAHFKAKDTNTTETISGISSVGNGPTPFRYSGLVANITLGTIAP